MQTMQELDPFTRAYLECILWAETDQTTEQGGDPLDENYGVEDFAPETLRAIVDDCQQFQQANRGNLARYNHSHYSAEELGGHDYWLTCNGHGCGFWDRDCLALRRWAALDKRGTQGGGAIGLCRG